MNLYIEEYQEVTLPYMHFLEKILAEKKTALSWGKVPPRPHHGVCFPLFSLKSSLSEGIGDFYDLFLAIDWVKKAKMDLIQLLPLNDTGLDKSPYSAQSAFALDPVYLRICALPGMDSDKNWEKKGRKLRRSLQKKGTSFFKVRKEKLLFLYQYFLAFFEKIKLEEEYLHFINRHSWLSEYGLYKALRHRFLEKPWYKWPTKYRNPKEKDLFLWSKKEEKTTQFYIFLQYLCFSQLSEVKKKAEERKILLMGDIPILVNYDSADVWFYRENFRLDLLAGAPPDMYNPEGQSWGFPTFNWEYLEKNDYAWWKKRIELTSLFYDLYRIDHLVGFFRIWSIKPFTKAYEGKFVSENRFLWPFLGKKRLESLLSFSTMLPIAEDLGTIPFEVRPILKELGICNTLVQRWEKTEEESFIDFQDYSPLSLCCLSTHDSENIKQWWEKCPIEAKMLAKMYNFPYQKTFSSDLRKALLEKMHRAPSLFHVNLLPEYLSLTYKKEEKVRINTPGTISIKNWSYRMDPCLEDLFSNTKLLKTLQDLVKE